MPEYLVLMKLNPNKIYDTLEAIRNTNERPLPGVDLCYSMNIFGSWDVGVWINAETNSEVMDFVQKKINGLNGVIEVCTVPTFPHGTSIKNGKNSEEQNPPLGP